MITKTYFTKKGKYLTTYHLSASNEDLQNKIWDESKEQQEEVKSNDDQNQISLETSKEDNTQLNIQQNISNSTEV